MSNNWYVADVLCSLIFLLTILARPTSGTEKHRKRVATKTVASVARTLVVKGWRSQDYEGILRNNLQQLDSDYEEVQGKLASRAFGTWMVRRVLPNVFACIFAGQSLPPAYQIQLSLPGMDKILEKMVEALLRSM